MNHLISALLTSLVQHFDGNTGWAIVTLSVGLRVALFPLTLVLARRALQRQATMRSLQPEIARLRTRHADDPQRAFEETMKVYRAHGCSPVDLRALVGSVLPLPVFALLWRAIGGVLGSAPRFYWIKNLATPNGWLTFLILVLTAAGAYFLPNGAGAARSWVIGIQVAVAFLLVWKVAAGYGLYWASSSAVGLVQSLWLRAGVRRDAAIKPAL